MASHEKTDGQRMIVDIPADVRMAIKLRAVKNHVTTGQVVSEAILLAFAKEVQEARDELQRRNKIFIEECNLG